MSEGRGDSGDWRNVAFWTPEREAQAREYWLGSQPSDQRDDVAVLVQALDSSRARLADAERERERLREGIGHMAAYLRRAGEGRLAKRLDALLASSGEKERGTAMTNWQTHHDSLENDAAQTFLGTLIKVTPIGSETRLIHAGEGDNQHWTMATPGDIQGSGPTPQAALDALVTALERRAQPAAGAEQP